MSDTKLKICGVKSVDEARVLLGLTVDYVGLNFVPSSSRYLTLEKAQTIMAEFNASDVKTVALFAGRSLEEVNDYVRRLDVDYVQLHGNEPADYARGVDAPVMRAVAIAPHHSAAELITFINDYPAEYFVLDRHQQGQGDLISLALAERVIAGTNKQIFFAGGLTPDNLADVLAVVKPYGIDIAGGVRTDDRLVVEKVKNCLDILHSTAH